MDSVKKNIQRGREVLKQPWNSVDYKLTDQALGITVPPQEKAFDEKGTFINLIPKEDWRINKTSVAEAILHRESRRKYSQEPLSLEELSFLLYATQGIRKHLPKYSFRTVPSGGARHSFETYLYINRVESCEKGLYRYLPVENRLYLQEPHRDNMEENLNAALNGQFWNAAVYFLWTTIPYRMEWKYSAVSAKIIAIDAGHMCQNLYLACEAIQCGTCGVAAYNQPLMDRFLRIDGEEEFAVYMAPVGKTE